MSAAAGGAGQHGPPPRGMLLAGGGSAGHVLPMLATADALRRRDPRTRITCLGTAEGLEARLVPAAGYELAVVPRAPLPRRPSAALLRLPGKLRAAVLAASEAIRSVGADVVVGFGGYVSVPAYLAARRLGVPIVVHESNARPGLANRLGARLGGVVAVNIAGTPMSGAQRLGMPLRREIARLDRAGSRRAAREQLGLDPDRTTLLAFGGSLGAQRLNDTFGAAAGDLLAAGVQVLHVTGAGKSVTPATGSAPTGATPVAGPVTAGVAAAGARYVSIPYLDRMDLAFAAADLAVCRAGASTVAELSAVGLPAVYVPLPVGNGEQRLNAAPVVAAGGALLADDAGCTPQWVRAVVLPLLADPERLATMGRAAAAQGVPDADEKLADLVLRVAR